MLRKISCINDNADANVKSVFYKNKLQTHYKYSVYDIDFNKVYYAPIQGALRAVKFISLVKEYGRNTTFMYLTAIVAGIDGIIGVSPNTIYNDNIKSYYGSIYESLEHYQDKIHVDKISITCEQVFKHVFGKSFFYVSTLPTRGDKYGMCTGYDFGCYRYAWDGTKVVHAGEEIIKDFNERFELFDDNSIQLGLKCKSMADYQEIFSKTYATIKECEQENEIKVIEFDDKPNTEKKRNVMVLVQTTLDCLDDISALGVIIM